MPLRITTETGSIYIIDTDAKTWRKERKPDYEGPIPLRSQSGSFDDISSIEIGKPVTMLGKPLDKQMTHRLIETSWVVAIEDINDEKI